MATKCKEVLDDLLHKTLHSSQNGVRYVVYNVAEQVMLDVLHKDVMGETLDAYIAKFLDAHEAVY